MAKRSLPNILVLALSLIVGGCLPRSVSMMLGLPQSLTITGKVVTASGDPAADVLVFAGSSTEAKTATDAAGQYSLTLDEADLLRLRAGNDTQRETFTLFFQKNLPEAQVALSAPVEQSARGARALGPVRLANPGSFKGLVQTLGKGRKLEPAHEARVRVGRHEVLTAADGTFELAGLPSGQLSLMVTARSFAPVYQTIELGPGAHEVSSEPIVLFEEPGIAGALIPHPAPHFTSEQGANGRLFMQSFYVRGSRTARYLRMAIEEERLEGAQWIPYTGVVDFDFPAAGGHRLFYQFADSEKTGFSPVYQLFVVINLFADSKGISINDGSGRATNAQVMVNVDVPRAAYRMRYAESPESLVSVPWGEVRPQFLYVFSSRHRSDFIDVEKAFQRNFYLQFEDATGAASIVFSTTVFLDLFPGADFMIGNGSGILASRLTPVAINLPPGAVEMRLADDYLKIHDMPWQNAEPVTTYLFTSRLDLNSQFWVAGGPRTLKVQFRDAAHFMSPVYERPVYINLFPDAGPVFTINFGSLYTATRTVTLQINVPPNAAEMRIFDPLTHTFDPLIGLDVYDILGVGIFPRNPTSSPWLRAQPLAYYYLPFLDIVSERVIHLQFRDLDGIVSPVYQQPVVFNPFPANIPIGATITGGTGQVLDVALVPPPSTHEYRIFDSAAAPGSPPWIEYQGEDTVTFVTTRASGPLMLTVQYKLLGSEAVATVTTNVVTLPLP